MKQNGKNMLDRVQRRALATKVTAAHKSAKEAAKQQSRPIVISLHNAANWNGDNAIELTGTNMPRQLVEQGLSVRNCTLQARGAIVFPPSKHPFPIVVTHVSIWDGEDEDKLLVNLLRINRPIILQPGDVLHFPRLEIEVCQ